MIFLILWKRARTVQLYAARGRGGTATPPARPEAPSAESVAADLVAQLRRLDESDHGWLPRHLQRRVNNPLLQSLARFRAFDDDPMACLLVALWNYLFADQGKQGKQGQGQGQGQGRGQVVAPATALQLVPNATAHSLQGNALLLRWFQLLCVEQGVSGDAKYFWKP